MRSCSTGCSVFYAIVLSLLLIPDAGAQQPQENNTDVSQSPWSMAMRGGYVYQFDTDLDQGGSFNVNSLFIQGGPVYSPDYRRSISLSVSYGHDGYDFKGYPETREEPWEEIHTLGLSAPVRWGYGRDWTLFAVPALRFTAENTSNWDDGVTGGGFVGFSYRFSDRLTIGPGIGLFSQLEDDTTVFPILIVSWKITDRLSLGTGRGLAVSRGPGLTLNLNMTDKWDFFLGGRYEKERFRLSNDGPVPGGIGENSSFPLFAGANYSFTKKIQASIVGGLKISGELRQEDQQGRLVAQEDYDSAPFLGVTFSGRF